MKILLINKYHFLKGGAERAYFDTARILSERGHTVIFFSMQHPDNEPTKWSRFFVPQVEYLDETLPILSKIRLAFKIIWNREAQLHLEQLLREECPDIAHIHNIYHQLSPSIFWTLKKHGIPMVMTLHDYKMVSPNYSLFVRGKIWEHTSGIRCIIDRCVKDSRIRSAVCAVEQWLHQWLGSYHSIQHFLAPSHFLIEKVQSLGFTSSIEYLPQPLLPFPPPPHIEKSASPYLYVGRLSAEKGLRIILEAFRELPQERLDIVGDGPERYQLEAFVKNNKLQNISFHGTVYGTELDALRRHAKAILIPSEWYENMPYTLLEALGAGKTVIAARIGGIAERITHGKNGFLFAPGNTHELIAILRNLSSASARDIEEAAYTSIQDLQPAIYAERLESIYQNLIKENTTKNHLSFDGLS